MAHLCSLKDRAWEFFLGKRKCKREVLIEPRLNLNLLFRGSWPWISDLPGLISIMLRSQVCADTVTQYTEVFFFSRQGLTMEFFLVCWKFLWRLVCVKLTEITKPSIWLFPSKCWHWKYVQAYLSFPGRFKETYRNAARQSSRQMKTCAQNSQQRLMLVSNNTVCLG